MRIPGYRDLAVIGSGATSVVYRALQIEFDRPVAVKVLTVDDPNDPTRHRFEREKATIGRLGDHPNIVQVLEAATTEDGRPFVAMQLYDGSAQDRLDEHGSFPVDEALDVMIAIAGATHEAHAAGILHNDIKPQNVLLSRHGPGLADFGIARSSHSLAQSINLSLTPWYAAPEAFDAEWSVQSDVWSLASTLYALLANRAPFAGAADESLLKLQARVARDSLPHIPRPDVRPELRAVLEQAMAKDPAERHGTAEELEHALRLIRGTGGDVSTSPAPPSSSQAHPGSTVDRSRLDDATPAPLLDHLPVAAPPSALAMDQGLTVDRRTADREAEQDASDAPGDVTETPNRGPLAVAAAVVVICALAGVWMTSGSKDDPSTAGDHQPVTVPESVPEADQTDDVQPTDFTVDDFGDSVDLAWNDGSGGALPHLVVIRNADGSQHALVPVPPGDTTMTVRDLDIDLGYCFVLVAVDSGQQSPPVEQGVRGGCEVDSSE